MVAIVNSKYTSYLVYLEQVYHARPTLYQDNFPRADAKLPSMYLPFVFLFVFPLVSALHTQLTLRLSPRLILESTPNFVSTLFCMCT